MNIKYLITLLVFALSIQVGQAQKFDIKTYEWEKEVKPFELPDSLKEEKAIIVFSTILVGIDPKAESQNQQRTVEHKRVYLNSDDAIERNNKIYISEQENAENNIQARVIQANGDVTYLDKKNIKQGEDEESGVKYSYYAVEGLKIGSEIETFTIKETPPNIYGSIMYLQKKSAILDFNFEFSYPSFLEFGFKVYNTSMEGKITEKEEMAYYLIESDYIPKYVDEPMSHQRVNMMYFIYKLDKNFHKNLNDINGFGYYSQIVGDRALNVEFSKSTTKGIDKVFNKIPLKADFTDKEKLVGIEHFIKSNFNFIDNNSVRELEEMDEILSKQAFNSMGSIQLYKTLLEKAGLSCSAVMTCNKSRVTFDKSFENYLFLDKLLLYVKEVDVAIDPEDVMSRLSFFDANYQGIDGLFIKSKKIGSMTTALGKVKRIPTSTSADNLSKAVIDIDLVDGFDEMKIKVAKWNTGHVAGAFQPLFSKVEPEYKDDFYEYVLYMHSGNVIPETIEFENTEAGDFPLKPFIQKYEVSNESYWEKGGANYILKLGELIGTQSQLYHDDSADRKNDVFGNYPKKYEYEINFNIPEGFEVVNLEDINFNIIENIPDAEFYFKSNYKVVGNKVNVKIEEIYDRDSYPAAYFEDFQKVINGAADFNKVSLIFKKK